MRSSLQEAVAILVFFVLMGIINACQAWGYRKIFVEDFTTEMRAMLNLDDPQTNQVAELNYQFYNSRSQTSLENLFNKSNYRVEVLRLNHQRERNLMKVLTENQKIKWQCCSPCKSH